MSDIVAEIDRVIAEELANRDLDRVIDLAHAARPDLRIQPWQRYMLSRALQRNAFPLDSLWPTWYRAAMAVSPTEQHHQAAIRARSRELAVERGHMRRN